MGIASRLSAAFSLTCTVVLVSQLGIAAAYTQPEEASDTVAVGPQYDSTHVYVAPEDFDRFVASVLATFGGTASKEATAVVTPTPSSTLSQVVFTPAGFFSVFGYKTPIPFPFGAERTGYLVTDMGEAIRQARAAGAFVIVAPFNDPIGRDAIIQFPGGVNTQLYWHTVSPTYAQLKSVPENRVYVSLDAAAAFVRSFLKFSRGSVVSDVRDAPGVEIGRRNETYRRIRIESKFGKLAVLVTDGRLPYPYGREVSGFEVSNIEEALSKAKAAGVEIIVPAFKSQGRSSAMLQFPGGFIAEIHAAAKIVPTAMPEGSGLGRIALGCRFEIYW